MILLDLDKTILDINMQITDLRIIEEIARLQADGWRIGLNSDRHFNSVMHFQRILQTNGPIIAEKGNIVRLSPNVSSSGYLVDARRDHFESLYMRFVNSLRRNDSQILVTSGDTMDWLRILRPLKEDPAKPVVIVNGERQYSFAFYAKLLDPTGFSLNPKLMSLLVERAVNMFREILGVTPIIDVNLHEYCACILHHPDSSKTQGIKTLQGLINIDFLAIVGDSDSDIIDLPRVIHTAVANATDNLKARSKFVSQKKLATGAIECLQFIEKTRKA